MEQSEMRGANRKPRYKRLFFVRYRNPEDQKFAIVKISKPSGGLLTCLPEQIMLKLSEESDEFRLGIFERLMLIDDVIVSSKQYEELKRFSIDLMEASFPEHASMVAEFLLDSRALPEPTGDILA